MITPEALDTDFRRIYFANSTPVKDMLPGDYFIALVWPDRVKRVSAKGQLHGVSGDIIDDWRAVTRITETQARFILQYGDAYRVWLIHGIEGLRKAMHPQVVQLPLFADSEVTA